MSSPSQPRAKHHRKMSLLSPSTSGTTTVVVFGASGDLAKKKTFPALFGLYRNELLPPSTQILGYARTQMDLKTFHERITSYIKIPKGEDEAKIKNLLQNFLKRCYYMSGQYDKRGDFEALNKRLSELEKNPTASVGPDGEDDTKNHRIFYLALPPSQFIAVATEIKTTCYVEDAINRVVVEKPFGKDLDSSRHLSRELGKLFDEDEIYRIDHYLGKEMVKNLLILRFANVFFGAIWSRNYIDNVQITVKERIGTQGRGGYFDEFGIIRDVMQNHILQILCIVAMEKPVSLSAEDVRDEKVKVLRLIKPIAPEDVVLGQYTRSADGKEEGYRDDKTVPTGSKTPTYAAAVLRINNDRWGDVPFILKCGKALNEQKTEIRIQFRDIVGNIFKGDVDRNELVIRVQPGEAVYMKMMNKLPGLSYDTVVSELDLSYDRRYSDHKIPDAYESLILDCLRGDHSNFVRDDELDAAWKIFTPILHKIDAGEIEPESYAAGSRGPEKALNFVSRLGYVRSQMHYEWRGGGKL